MNEYLAFVDYIGKSLDDKFIYRFDFTNDTDTVWGDYFNIAPTIIVPDLQPEENTICKSGRVLFDNELNLAKRNGCFSMQDCFDGIIALAFSELSEENTVYYNDEPLYFNFGEPIETVEEKLKSLGYEFYDVIDKQIGDESIIDDLIENIDTIEEDKESSLETNYEELFTFKIKEDYDFEELKKLFFDNGYEGTDYVHKEGQYTFRGHIVDIYSFNQVYPIRLSFFGRTLEKISKFDEYDQNEIERLEEITIYKTKVEN